MGQLVGIRDEFQIGLGAEPIRTGGNRFAFRDPYTGKTATGLMSVLEWNVAADKWVQVAPPQGDRPASQFSAWVNKQLEVVWSQPIGRLRQPARPREAELESGISIQPYKAPGSTIPVPSEPAPAPAAVAPAPALVAPTAPPPAPAPARAVIPTAEITTALAPSFPAATAAAVLPTNGVSAPAGFAMPDLPTWAWIAIAGGGVYLFTRK